jgi:hypothetical protein
MKLLRPYFLTTERLGFGHWLEDDTENQAWEGLLRRLGFRRTHEELYGPTGRMHPHYRLNRAHARSGADYVLKSIWPLHVPPPPPYLRKFFE